MSPWRVARDDEPVNAWRNESRAIGDDYSWCLFVARATKPEPMTDEEYMDRLAALSAELLGQWLDVFYLRVGAA